MDSFRPSFQMVNRTQLSSDTAGAATWRCSTAAPRRRSAANEASSCPGTGSEPWRRHHSFDPRRSPHSCGSRKHLLWCSFWIMNAFKWFSLSLSLFSPSKCHLLGVAVCRTPPRPAHGSMVPAALRHRSLPLRLQDQRGIDVHLSWAGGGGVMCPHTTHTTWVYPVPNRNAMVVASSNMAFLRSFT